MKLSKKKSTYILNVIGILASPMQVLLLRNCARPDAPSRLVCTNHVNSIWKITDVPQERRVDPP
jgi:hypothetical protein